MIRHPQDDAHTGTATAEVFDPKAYAADMDFVWTRKDRSTVRLGDLDFQDLNRLDLWIHKAITDVRLKRVAAAHKGDTAGVEGLGVRLAFLLSAREAIAGIQMYSFATYLDKKDKAPKK